MPSKIMIAAMAVSLLFGTTAMAQFTTPAYDPTASPADLPPAPAGGAVIDNGLTITTSSSSDAAPTASPIPSTSASLGYIPPYSYYAAPEGYPARPYIGLGAMDAFPFHGQPYGYPYDRWTWDSMSGSPPSSLVRYNYPPVP